MAKIIEDITSIKNRLAFQNFEMEQALMSNDASSYTQLQQCVPKTKANLERMLELIVEGKHSREEFVSLAMNQCVMRGRLYLTGIYDVNIYKSMLKKALTTSGLKKIISYQGLF